MIPERYITEWSEQAPWVVKQKKHNNTLVFKVQPTDPDAGEIHLKVEINCKEHFSVYPMVKVPFAVNSSWFKGACEVRIRK